MSFGPVLVGSDAVVLLRYCSGGLVTATALESTCVSSQSLCLARPCFGWCIEAPETVSGESCHPFFTLQAWHGIYFGLLLIRLPDKGANTSHRLTAVRNPFGLRNIHYRHAKYTPEKPCFLPFLQASAPSGSHRWSLLASPPSKTLTHLSSASFFGSTTWYTYSRNHSAVIR